MVHNNNIDYGDCIKIAKEITNILIRKGKFGLAEEFLGYSKSFSNNHELDEYRKEISLLLEADKLDKEN